MDHAGKCSRSLCVAACADCTFDLPVVMNDLRTSAWHDLPSGCWLGERDRTPDALATLVRSYSAGVGALGLVLAVDASAALLNAFNSLRAHKLHIDHSSIRSVRHEDACRKSILQGRAAV